MEKSNSFILKIENQRWLTDEDTDVCSHGEIYLNINGTILTQTGIEEEWGISESALALLRTLDRDYTCDPEKEEGLILHGCGLILMMGCPISIHWSVKHKNDKVILSDFVKVTTTNPQTGSVHYPGLVATVSRNEYQNQILSFAQQAKRWFDSSKEKRITDNFDKEMYMDFWSEYNRLIRKALL
ncbi:hypothetical protein D0469_07495 [Peribacillus saganii]|uniref:Uncharacterized protein n=1 Tax=Peribacillus saganii TaxID=2303992 RepID=A0A372LRL0_9BACI|nr:hypothetical protein [Peribacillus saganii]RFU70422.1 hypothetical protein D0469_07495 [Peribacillus saganii]